MLRKMGKQVLVSLNYLSAVIFVIHYILKLFHCDILLLKYLILLRFNGFCETQQALHFSL